MVSKTAAITSILAIIGLSSATRVHVNKGCILVGEVPACAGDGKGSPVRVAGGKATIFARFSGNPDAYYDNAGCILRATWPEAYGDIYYGANNCLYDSKGQKIGGQCCTQGSAHVRNPYNVWR